MSLQVGAWYASNGPEANTCGGEEAGVFGVGLSASLEEEPGEPVGGR